MYALKQLIVVPVLALMLGSASLLAQMSDSFTSSATQVAGSLNSGDPAPVGWSRYYWIAGVLFILLVFAVGYGVRSRTRKNDNPHLSGDSINNPASGI